MGRYFGTDGIRGRAGVVLTPEIAVRAAHAYAKGLAGVRLSVKGARPGVALGRDPRLSSPMLAAAVQAGLNLGGCDAVSLGIVPTPAVPYAMHKLRCAGGVMITASHNPIEDNGVKFFGSDGHKLGSKDEARIDSVLCQASQVTVAGAADIGGMSEADVGEQYVAGLVRATRQRSAARSLRIILDCAYGATSVLAPLAFRRAGHQVDSINARFDGARINVRCGATDLRMLRRAVVRARADLGLAFDGDGDRVLAVDHRGRDVSGDVIIALFATRLQRYRRRGAVVMTKMTNVGVERALAQRGVSMVRTEVGDTKVLAAMLAQGIDLGGEQSGHIIMHDKSVAGDGILSGLQLAALLSREGRPLADMAEEFPQFPQLLTNLRVRDRSAWQTDPAMRRKLAKLESAYPGVRFYLRSSGTEDVLRVLTEAESAALCQQANDAVCKVILEWGGRAK